MQLLFKVLLWYEIEKGVLIMLNDKNQTVLNEQRTPIFTGNYIRDNVVSDTEKVAEVSQTIYENLTKRSAKKKNERKI